VRLQENPDRYDQKLDPINLAGVFKAWGSLPSEGLMAHAS